MSGVLDALDRALEVLDARGARASADELREAIATVAELIAADGEYDSALAAFNNTAATRPDWPQYHARFESAKIRRAKAMETFRGQL